VEIKKRTRDSGCSVKKGELRLSAPGKREKWTSEKNKSLPEKRGEGRGKKKKTPSA